MAGADQGPEPSGWELMRRLDSLEASINKVGDRVVPFGVYDSDKRGITDRFVRAEARIKDIEQGAVEGDKLRRTTRLAIAISIVSPILSIAGGFLVKVIS